MNVNVWRHRLHGRLALPVVALFVVLIVALALYTDSAWLFALLLFAADVFVTDAYLSRGETLIATLLFCLVLIGSAGALAPSRRADAAGTEGRLTAEAGGEDGEARI